MAAEAEKLISAAEAKDVAFTAELKAAEEEMGRMREAALVAERKIQEAEAAAEAAAAAAEETAEKAAIASQTAAAAEADALRDLSNQCAIEQSEALQLLRTTLEEEHAAEAAEAASLAASAARQAAQSEHEEAIEMLKASLRRRPSSSIV